jgi:hypothetical protein
MLGEELPDDLVRGNARMSVEIPLTLIRFDPPVLIFSDPWMVS